VCPQCHAPRQAARHVYCEVCGYNFRTGTSGIPPVSRTVLVPESPRHRPAVEANPKKTMPAMPSWVLRWEVEIEVDGALYGTPNADAPVGQPKQVFPLFDDEILIGRAGTEVRVQVPVRDPGVSRRQALLVRRGLRLFLRDLNSANGTQLNGKDIVPGVDTPVQDGDRIALGAWTRLTLRAVAEEAEEGRS
jgi:hypothetical protein